MKTSSTVHLRIMALGFGCLSLVSIAPAQSAAPPSSTDGEVITLSPFEVSAEQDYGYQAASTISATALATPLKESSSVVGILTKDFLDDINAATIEEAASWVPNTYFQDAAEMGDEALTAYSSNAVIRGVNAQSGLGRDYFITNAPLDPATIERIEQPRGPNAALFGAAPQVGMVNVNPKKALFQRQFNRLDFRGTNHGTLRGAFDANFGADRLAFRMNAMKETVEGWRNGDQQSNELLLLSGAWRIGRTTTLRAEAMWDRREGSFPPPNLYENVSKWDGTTVFTGPRTSNPAAATGTTRVSGTNDYFLFDSTDGYATPLNWKGFGRTTGYNLATFPDAALAAELRPGIPDTPVLESREFTFNSEQTPMSEKSTRVFGASLEHLFFGKLAAQVAFNYTYTDTYKWQFSFNSFTRDINTVRPDGTDNPHFGDIYVDQTYRRDDIAQYQRNLRVLLSYPFKWGFMEQRLVGMAGTRSEARNQTRLQLVRTDNAAQRLVNNVNNRIWFRRYAADGNSPLPFLGTGSFGGIDIDLLPWNLNYTRARTKFWQAALAGRYWDGKVTTSLGWRHDYVSTTRLTVDSAANIDTGIGYHFTDPEKSRPNSLTGGIVYFPMRSLGVFANYAEGYNVQGVRPDLFGNLWPTPKYKGVDIGVKVELFDGRVSGTISRYTSKREGVDPQAFSPQNNFGQLWLDMVNGYTSLATGAENAGDAALAAQYTAQANAAQAEQDKIFGTAYDSRNLEANGWEVDLTANLTKNWRAMVNFGLPETKQADASPISRAYYAEHVAEWSSHVDDTANFNTGSIQNQLKVIEDGFRGEGEGASTVGTPDYTANIFTTYRISSGRWKGLRFGGGVQFQGPRIIGVPAEYVATSATAGSFVTPDVLATIKCESTQLVSAMIAYEFKIQRKKMKVQLNIANLLDEDDLIATNVATYTVPVTPSAANPIQGYQVPNRFRYINPRTFTLSCSIEL